MIYAPVSNGRSQAIAAAETKFVVAGNKRGAPAREQLRSEVKHAHLRYRQAEGQLQKPMLNKQQPVLTAQGRREQGQPIWAARREMGKALRLMVEGESEMDGVLGGLEQQALRRQQAVALAREQQMETGYAVGRESKHMY